MSLVVRLESAECVLGTPHTPRLEMLHAGGRTLSPYPRMFPKAGSPAGRLERFQSGEAGRSGRGGASAKRHSRAAWSAQRCVYDPRSRFVFPLAGRGGLA